MRSKLARTLWSTRRRRVLSVTLALMLAATAAWAAWRSFAPVDGSVDTASAPVAVWGTSPAPSVVSGDCTVGLSGGKLIFTFSGTVPGDACVVSAPVTTSSGEGVVQRFAPADDGTGTPWTLGAEVAAAVDAASCGAAVSTSTSATVQMRLEVLEGAEPSSSYALSDGLEVVPGGMYDAALCQSF